MLILNKGGQAESELTYWTDDSKLWYLVWVNPTGRTSTVLPTQYQHIKGDVGQKDIENIFFLYSADRNKSFYYPGTEEFATSIDIKIQA